VPLVRDLDPSAGPLQFFGAELRRARAAAGLSQDQLGQRLGYSGAQVGKNVHLSGGAGIGGVLEPPNAVPVVIEDEAMIGSRCMVVEGARVRTGAVLGPGTHLGPTTHVIDVETGAELARGEAPAWSVCVGGTRPRTFPGGTFGMSCVLVLRRLSPGIRHDKAALNAILRDHGVDA